jgi:hypothetical protein
MQEVSHTRGDSDSGVGRKRSEVEGGVHRHVVSHIELCKFAHVVLVCVRDTLLVVVYADFEDTGLKALRVKLGSLILPYMVP